MPATAARVAGAEGRSAAGDDDDDSGTASGARAGDAVQAASNGAHSSATASCLQRRTTSEACTENRLPAPFSVTLMQP
ncbi:MAG: hypothetical protein JWP11_889 [Frankiales bacterium]|nr:hypothetical protein [Frankiales bacterium]